MITEEQIKEAEWQNGIYQLKKGCQELLDDKYCEEIIGGK